ncbi:Oidioi.mRNA.OKI2018_I69.XSR.g16835.t1.cds [Oikopleura dioica]|uniref:Oidioi.mRNA.OKI2018_I69.XSR.g16835.t1.cds n=1 Tax=Oikopleura dioica TaxID=34765 RepID=A0ABN7SL81_OIKDI|nr:Oidioi.mRNA.OKI2018_I69.XSR.g16835.t1.cds [Oikopleura dioica]
MLATWALHGQSFIYLVARYYLPQNRKFKRPGYDSPKSGENIQKEKRELLRENSSEKAESSTKEMDHALMPPQLASLAPHQKLQPKVDSDIDEKICVVCEDFATGYHFNAMTCEGCKGFFRRTNCAVTRQNRRQCQACRFQKCLTKGMKRDCILSDLELNKKRKIIQKNRIKRILNENPDIPQVEQEKISKVVAAYDLVQKQCAGSQSFRNCEDMPNWQRTGFRSDVHNMIYSIEKRLLGLHVVRIEDPRTGENESITININYLKHMSDVMNSGLLQLINFSKQIPEFAQLEQNDQVELIRAGTREIVILQAATYFDLQKRAFVNYDSQMEYTFDILLDIGLKELFIERLSDFLVKFTQIDLSKEEFLLTLILVLFSPDRAGLQNPTLIGTIQDSYAELLERLMISPRTKAKYGKNRFSDIISLQLSLRFLSFMTLPLGKAFHDQLASDVLPPLLKEMLA